MSGLASIVSGAPKQQSVDYAAQAAAQKVAREDEQYRQLEADRAKSVAKADEARDAEATRLKKQAASRSVAASTGALAAETMSAALSKKLG